MIVGFGEWLPDLPPLGNKGSLEARNVIAQKESYRALKSLAPYTNALTGAALGAAYIKDASNTAFNFAGDATDLYRLAGSSWTAVSKAGGYTAADWEFARFGTRMIAVHQNDVPQYFDVGVSALFADLPGAPPQAARAAVVRDFVVLGDLSTDHEAVYWSGFNNSEIWGDLTAQSDFNKLFNGGRVQKVVGGEYGVIFKEHTIYRMDYIGGPNIFAFDEIEEARGTPAPGSVIRQGSTIFYLGHDGFHMFDGQGSQAIGSNRVDDWFASEIAPDAYSSIRSAIDRRNRLAVWAFRSSSAGTVNDRLLIYNFGANRWSYGQVDTEILADLLSVGFTLDDLDVPLPEGVDIDSILSESPQYVGGNLSFVAFNSAHRAATFNGAVLDAVIDTKEFSDKEGQRLSVTEVRPLVSAFDASIQVQMGTRDQQQNGYPVYGAQSALDASGKADVRANARYHRARLQISGDFDHAQGCEVRARKAGRR